MFVPLVFPLALAWAALRCCYGCLSVPLLRFSIGHVFASLHTLQHPFLRYRGLVICSSSRFTQFAVLSLASES